MTILKLDNDILKMSKPSLPQLKAWKIIRIFTKHVFTVPPESIYPLAHVKTSFLPKSSPANSPWWDEFLNLVLDGHNRKPHKPDAVYHGEETIEANFFCKEVFPY